MKLHRRRLFLLAGALVAAAPAVAWAQKKIARVGILLPAKGNEGLLVPYRKRLGELGWIEGKNLAIEIRNAENRYERLPALVRELVELKVDLIVTASTPVTRAAKEARLESKKLHSNKKRTRRNKSFD